MKKIAHSILIVLGTSFSVVFAAAPFDFGTTLRTIEQQNVRVANAIKQNATQSTLAFEQAMKEHAAAITNGIAVEAKQNIAVSDAIIKADMDARILYMNIKDAQARNQEIAEVHADYGAVTGQSYAPCRIIKEANTATQLQKEAKTISASLEQTTDNAAGTLAKNAHTTQKIRDAKHIQHFCNESDVEQGRCSTVSAYAGMDVNAGVLNQSASAGSVVDIAKDTVRQNIMGSPYFAIDKTQAKTAHGQAYLYEVNHATALMAFPAHTLAYLQSLSTVREDIKDADGQPMSPNDKRAAIVARYYGSDEATEWTKSIVVQRPRALLVSLSELQDIAIWQKQELIDLNFRSMGNKAAAVLAQAQGLDVETQKQIQAIKTAQARSAAGS